MTLSIIILSLVFSIAGCARIVVLIGTENKTEAGVGADNIIDVNRRDKEKQ